ncbi:hypothetical protein GCM10027084_06990 [Pseudoxanthomonas sangjuensis]
MRPDMRESRNMNSSKAGTAPYALGISQATLITLLANIPSAAQARKATGISLKQTGYLMRSRLEQAGRPAGNGDGTAP